MPIFLAALLGGLLSAASSMVGRVLVALGVSYVTYEGLSTVFDWIVSAIHSDVASLPAAIVGVLTLTQVDTCVSILASAYTARFVIAGLTSGAITKMVIK